MTRAHTILLTLLMTACGRDSGRVSRARLSICTLALLGVGACASVDSGARAVEKWTHDCENLGNVDWCLRAARALTDGKLVTPDPPKALRLLRGACTLGSGEGCAEAARQVEGQSGASAARRLFEQACALEVSESCAWLEAHPVTEASEEAASPPVAEPVASQRAPVSSAPEPEPPVETKTEVSSAPPEADEGPTEVAATPVRTAAAMKLPGPTVYDGHLKHYAIPKAGRWQELHLQYFHTTVTGSRYSDEFGAQCSGWFGDSPNAVIRLDRDWPGFVVYVRNKLGMKNLSMAIQTPTGQVWCDHDSGEGKMPRIAQEGSPDTPAWPKGDYLLWLSVPNAGDTQKAQVEMKGWPWDQL